MASFLVQLQTCGPTVFPKRDFCDVKRFFELEMRFLWRDLLYDVTPLSGPAANISAMLSI